MIFKRCVNYCCNNLLYTLFNNIYVDEKTCRVLEMSTYRLSNAGFLEFFLLSIHTRLAQFYIYRLHRTPYTAPQYMF